MSRPGAIRNLALSDAGHPGIMNRRSLLIVATDLAAAPLGAQAAEGGESAPVGGFVPMTGLSASLPQVSGRRQILSIEYGVDVVEASLAPRVEQSRPRLHAAAIQAAQRAANGLRPGMAPDVDLLARELQSAIDSALGSRGAQVLLGTVMVV